MRKSIWSVPFKNPFFAIYEIVETESGWEQYNVIKICKSIQTVKKYMLNTDKRMGWSAWCKDVYPGIENNIMLGQDVNSISFRDRIQTLKVNMPYVCL